MKMILLNKFLNKTIPQNYKFPSFESLCEKYDVIIHIGTPKSGTSALQYFMMNNRKLLFKKGIYYPNHGLGKNGISGGHSKLAIALMENRLEDAQVIFDTWCKEAKELDKLLLISSEALFNLAKKMQPLIENKKVLIIAYYRDISGYLVSAHNQLIKRHFSTKTIRQYVELFLNNTNKTETFVNKSFLLIFGEWETLVNKENLIVRSYQKECFLDAKIEKDFINRIGLDADIFKVKSKRINISYSADALELKRMINFVLEKDSPLNHRIDLALQTYSEKQNGVSGSSDNDLSGELNLRIESYFEKSEKLIQDKYIENYMKIRDTRSSNIRGTQGSKVHIKSLQKTIDHLLKDNKIKNYLHSATLIKLESGSANYSTFKLAELLSIESLEDYGSYSDNWFSDGQLKSIGAGKYEEADFLRDIAKLLLKRENYVDAEKIIQQALKLRPSGPVIIELNESIQKYCLESNNKL